MISAFEPASQMIAGAMSTAPGSHLTSTNVSTTAANSMISDLTSELLVNGVQAHHHNAQHRTLGGTGNGTGSGCSSVVLSSNHSGSPNSPTGLSGDEPYSVASISSSATTPPSTGLIEPQNMLRIFHEARSRLHQKQKLLDSTEKRLHAQYNKALNDSRHAYQLIIDQLEKGRSDVNKELDDIYNSRKNTVASYSMNLDECAQRTENIIQFLEQAAATSSTSNEIQNDLLTCKAFIDSKLQTALNTDIDTTVGQDIDFVNNYQVCQVLMRNNILGHFRVGSSSASGVSSAVGIGGGGNPQSVISKSILNTMPTGNGAISNNASNNLDNFCDRFSSLSFNSNNANNNLFGNGRTTIGSTAGVGNPSTAVNGTSSNDSLSLFGTYDRWSNGLNHSTGNLSRNDNSPDSFFTPTSNNAWCTGAMENNIGSLMTELGSNDMGLLDSLGGNMMNGLGGMSSGAGPNNPIKSQCQRQKMIYHCKFGEFGTFEGQFTEPSGVAINAQNDIIVADTNNHRVQIFDKDGRFKFQFGECGKRDGQLLYPNRVAVVKESGDIIVTERSPTHQIQVFNQYGQFVRKFGADVLQHPRGVTVDPKGNIVIVECKVMRVIIFDLHGNVLQKFGCSKHLEFPNGVVVNDKQEIFISDNRAHCVKVFSYSGQFLRNIGGEGLTNYPIGVCINEAGEILVADNHNNFNITIFTQDGQLINALESKVKHSQCFDVALMDDHSVVLASKDYRVYIYRYLQLQCLAATVATNGIC